MPCKFMSVQEQILTCSAPDSHWLGRKVHFSELTNAKVSRCAPEWPSWSLLSGAGRQEHHGTESLLTQLRLLLEPQALSGLEVRHQDMTIFLM